MPVRDSWTSSANGAFGRHERHDSDGMRFITAASGWRSTASFCSAVTLAKRRQHRATASTRLIETSVVLVRKRLGCHAAASNLINVSNS
jgi:hypothetical protein